MNNGKAVRVAIIFSFLVILSKSVVFASSAYVLPYPSTMPGNKMYKLRLIFEQAEKYWYFGSLSQFKYNLSLSDKYLVEAKTLFEYKQFLLAYSSLQKSNDYFSKAPYFLVLAKKEGKEINEKKDIFRSASEKHQEVLKILEEELPDVYTWTPEKEKSSELQIKNAIEKAIEIRKQI